MSGRKNDWCPECSRYALDSDTWACSNCGAELAGPPENPPHRPDRDSDVAAWIKQARDRWRPKEGKSEELNRDLRTGYCALDALLDDYRLHADTGTPLSEEVEEP